MTTGTKDIPPVYEHGDIFEVKEDVFYVEGEVIMRMVHFPRGMTVIRENGQLTIINAVRLNDAGEEALLKLGEVTNVLCIGCHDMDILYYARRFSPTIFALPGLAKEVPNVKNIRDGLPCRGRLVQFPRIEHAWPESFIVRDDVLITCDSVQNWERPKTNWLGRFILPWYGFSGKCIFDTFLLNMLRKKGVTDDDFKADMEMVLGVDYKYLLSGHGYCIDGTAKETIQYSFRKMFG